MKRALVCLCLLAAACVKSEIGGPGSGAGGKTGGGGAGGADSGQGGAGANATTGTGGNGGQGPEQSGTGGALPDSTSCNQLAVGKCAGNAMCAVLNGQRITGSPACLAAAEPVGCGTNQGCLPTPVRATDPKNMDWLFPSTCIPAGWTDNSSKGTRFDPCPAADGGTAGDKDAASQ